MLFSHILPYTFQAQQQKSRAKDQMNFQREMSNSSYQRSMADMKKSGLNPILAGKLGGASTPGGAMASVPDFGKGLSQMGPQAMQMQLQKAQIAQTASTAQKLRNEATMQQMDIDMLRKRNLSPLAFKHTVLNQAGSELYQELKDNYSNAKDVTFKSLDQTTGYFKKLAHDIKNRLNMNVTDSDLMRILMPVPDKAFIEKRNRFNKRLRNNK